MGASPLMEQRGQSRSERTCTQTGLRLVPSGGAVFRIAKPSRGPLNPPSREDGDRTSWGRFDVPGQQTVYGGRPAETAYAESLASLRVSTDMEEVAANIFDDESPEDASRTLRDLVRDDWLGRSHMAPDLQPAGWRHDRLLYELTLPPNDWFVDICHADSMAAVRQELASILAECEADPFTISHLTGENRTLTTTISAWVWGLNLDDGSRPHGIRFLSKHGSNYECFAIYLRALGDGKDLDSEPTKSDDGTEIKEPDQNAPLARVIKNFGIDRLF